MSNVQDIIVPDIGDFDDVEVIEVITAVGDKINIEDSLITLETDKATMEVPSSHAGTLLSVNVAIGDRVSRGNVIATVKVDEGAAEPTEIAASTDMAAMDKAPTSDSQPASTLSANDTASVVAAPSPGSSAQATAQTASALVERAADSKHKAYASPSVRRFARELGADINSITGSGNKNRILKEDVQAFIKNTLAGQNATYGGATTGCGMCIPRMQEIDFSAFGETECVEMGRINKLSAANLHRAWLNVPHVTQHDEADITEMEAFRKSLKQETEKKGIRVTGLVFHMKALACALAEFPKFNSSLAADGQSLVYKKYFHIGIAIDTPNGLVVPVFRDINKKTIYQLSEELMDVSKRSREKKLKPQEMQGACITISSLGGIGGTAFTPIVNAPEAAILGISRARMQPVWDGQAFVPRLMCPLDISYDHRIIDGADAARFLVFYCQAITDIRRLLL